MPAKLKKYYELPFYIKIHPDYLDDSDGKYNHVRFFISISDPQPDCFLRRL